MKNSNKSFTTVFDVALLKAEMIRKMAISDGWAGLDECMEQAPQALDILLRHADAALTAVKEAEAGNIKPSSI